MYTLCHVTSQPLRYSYMCVPWIYHACHQLPRSYLIRSYAPIEIMLCACNTMPANTTKPKTKQIQNPRNPAACLHKEKTSRNTSSQLTPHHPNFSTCTCMSSPRRMSPAHVFLTSLTSPSGPETTTPVLPLSIPLSFSVQLFNIFCTSGRPTSDVGSGMRSSNPQD